MSDWNETIQNMGLERSQSPVEASVTPEGTQDTLGREEGFYWVRPYWDHKTWYIGYWDTFEVSLAGPSLIGFSDTTEYHSIEEWGPRLEPPTFTTKP